MLGSCPGSSTTQPVRALWDGHVTARGDREARQGCPSQGGCGWTVRSFWAVVASGMT